MPAQPISTPALASLLSVTSFESPHDISYALKFNACTPERIVEKHPINKSQVLTILLL